MTELAVVVVNHNTRDLLRSCLETVRAEGTPGITEVVVVDNASTDGSPGMVRAEFPGVRVLANRHNPGYGAGANQGIAACRAPYVLLLNSDTLLGEGSAAALAGWLDRHPRAAVVGPRLVNPDGTLQSSCFPELTPFNVLALNTWLNRLARVLPRFRPTWRGTPSESGHWVKGAALAIRREAFQAVGGFDESFFMYAEEVDLCLRLSAAGWEVHYTPEATVVHVEGASTEQNRHAMAARLFASLEQLYRRHYPGKTRRLRWVLRAVLVERIARDRWKMWRYPERRGRLEGDVALWRRMLGERDGERTEGTARTARTQIPWRCDWRFLLSGRTFEHLILLGGTGEMAEWLREAGVARRVSESLDEPAEAVAVLQGAGVAPEAAARCLAPGGRLYWESDERRSLKAPFAVPGRAVARLRACGLEVSGVWAVWPGFERCEACVPVEDLGWFARAGYPGRTLKERLTGLALRWTRNGALITRCFAIVAGPVEKRALLTHGAERVVLVGDDVRKVPRLPAFNAKTVREQEILVQVRGMLDRETVRAIPEPRGTMRYGDRLYERLYEITASIESRAPGRPLVLACADWGVPLRRKIRYLRMAAEWLTRFHLQTLIRREPWDGREVADSFAAFRDRFGVSPQEESLFAFALGQSRELAGLPFPIVWRHRDFTPWNLLVDRDRLTVLDWEGAQPGPALCDLLHFISHWDELAPLGAPASRRQVTRYCDQLGVDPRFIPLLRVYTRVEIALRSPVRTRDADYVAALAEEIRRAA